MRIEVSEMNKFVCFLAAAFSVNASALDTKNIESQCTSIGFKYGTEPFGDCVIKLLDLSADHSNEYRDDSASAAERLRQRQEQYRLEAELASAKHEQDKKEQELLKLQRRQVEAAEEAARAQRTESSLRMMETGLRMMSPPPPSSSTTTIRTPSGRFVNCHQTGGFINCF